MAKIKMTEQQKKDFLTNYRLVGWDDNLTPIYRLDGRHIKVYKEHFEVVDYKAIRIKNYK